MADSTRPWTPPPSALTETAATTHPAIRPPRAIPGLFVQRVLGLVAIAIAGASIGYYIITPLPYRESETFLATVTLHAITGIVLIPYLCYLIVARRLPGGSTLDLPLLTLFFLYFFSTAFSEYWRVGLEVTLVAVTALGVFAVLSDGWLLRRWQVEAAVMLVLFAASGWALWLVGQEYADWLRLANAVDGGISVNNVFPPAVPKIPDRVANHPNILGGMLAMGLPLFFVSLFRPWPAALRALVALASVVVLLAIFLSLARSAWLAGGAGLLTTALLLFAFTPSGRTFVQRVWPATPGRQALAGLAALLLAGAALGVALLAQAIDARPLWLFRESTSPRVDVINAGLDMLRDHLYIGTGPGTYGLFYAEYSGRYPAHAFHAHNGFLQAAIDLGIPGVIAVTVLIAAVGWLIYRGLLRADPGARLSLAACAGAFVALAVFALFDAPNRSKGPLVLIAAIGAIAVTAARENETQAPTGERLTYGQAGQLLARIGIPIALIGMLITWGRLDFSHYYYSSGIDHADAQRWPDSASRLERAVELDPQYALYRLELGLVHAQQYKATEEPALLTAAIADFRKTIELEPRSAIARVNLALLEAELGQRDITWEDAIYAIRYARGDAAVNLAAGTAFENTDWPMQAVFAYAFAIFLDQDIATSQFWASSQFRRDNYWDIIAHSGTKEEPCRLLELYEGNVPEGPLTRQEALTSCGQAVQVNPDELEGRVILADAFIVDGHLEEARTLIDEVLARQPDNAEARTSLGRWYEAQSDIESGREQWLRAGHLGDTDGYVLLGDSYPAGHVPREVTAALRDGLRGVESQTQFDIASILYFRYKFFRSSPRVMILPGEWQGAVPARYERATGALDRWAAATPPTILR